jgi:sigma-54-specific transcriptional regulator
VARHIRELENIVHYALIVCRAGRVERSDVRLPYDEDASPRPAQAPQDEGLGLVRQGLRHLIEARLTSLRAPYQLFG